MSYLVPYYCLNAINSVCYEVLVFHNMYRTFENFIIYKISEALLVTRTFFLRKISCILFSLAL
jgi:hypothetical protein